MKVRKKPVVVNAIRLNSEDAAISELRAFLTPMEIVWVDARGDALEEDDPAVIPDDAVGILLATLEGLMIAHWGDWIIRGVKGELYPCKHHIFELTYEVLP